MIHGRSRASRISLLLACPLLAGCPLPLARTETTSAPLVGSIAWEDGRVASDVEIIVSTGWRNHPCGTSDLRTRSDSAGRFELPASWKRYTTTWIIPNYHRGLPRFRLCAGVRDSMRLAYTGYGALGQSIERDTVACVIWESLGSPRVNCSGKVQQAVITGGNWGKEPTEGRERFFRVFLTEESVPLKGDDKGRTKEQPHVYVQWVERTGADAAQPGAPIYRVHATKSLSFDRNKVWAVQRVRLWRRGGVWMASLEGIKHAFMNDFARSELVFSLGEPGEATLVAGP